METSLRLGEIEAIPLLDGVCDLPGPMREKFAIPDDANLAPFHERHPLLFSDQGWRLHLRCTLILVADRRILVDTGVGHVGAPASSWFCAAGHLEEELAGAGVASEDIDTVVLTHVHDDHIGGAVAANGTAAFPNARYLLQRADLDQQLRWAQESEEDRVIWESLLSPLEETGRLDLVDGRTSMDDGITLLPAPGHTPGHQVVEIRSGTDRLLLSGDAVNHPFQLAYPDWASASDSDPHVAALTRAAMTQELVGSQVIVGPSHFAEPFGHLVADADGRAGWRPL